MSLSLLIADPPEAWADLGFSVADSVCRVGDVVFVLGAQERRGVRAWSLPSVDGLRTFDAAGGEVGGGASHPNGVVDLDHLVVTTPDHRRTLAAFEAAGWDLRRVRETDTYGAPMRQAFYKIGRVVLEVVGPAEPMGDSAARFWGLAFVSADLDATAAYLGDRLHPAKDAVQPGRRIATLDKAAGSTVPIAFMSPAP